ncbi:MAG: zinc ABC transporter substrate-binding protein [Planctomycetota bacterium]
MRTAILILAATLLVVPGCGGSGDDGLTVVTSVLPHAWLVKQIGGEYVKVVTLVGPGESPATYQPTDRQVSEVMRAKTWFRTGVPFENGSWKDTLSGSGVKVVDLREGIQLRHLCSHEHEGHVHEGEDPHVWLSTAHLSIQATVVSNELCRLDPDHAGEFERNLSETLEELRVLDEDLRKVLGPVGRRRVYVFHPSWGYFLDSMNMTQVAIEIEGKEPSEAEITKLVAAAKKDGVRVIFVQPQIAGQTADAIAKAIGAEVRRIDPLAEDVPANLRKVAKEIAAAYE